MGHAGMVGAQPTDGMVKGWECWGQQDLIWGVWEDHHPPPKKKALGGCGRMWKDWHLELFGVVFGDVGPEVRELRVVDMKA